MPIKCNVPFFADQDPDAPPRGVSGIGVGPTYRTAAAAAGEAAISNAREAGRAWFDGKECPRNCPDKQGGYNHSSQAFAYNTVAHIVLPFGFNLWVVQAGARWNGVVICRRSEVEG